MEATIFIIDDDQAVRDALTLLFETEEMAVEAYASAEAFLDAYKANRPGCLLLDIRMPGMSGLELQQALTARQLRIPIIFITGHGDIAMSVQAIKAGALDFIEKPFNDELLLNRVRGAIAYDLRYRQEAKERQAALLIREEKAQETLHSIGDAIITTNTSGNVEYLNPIAAQLTGWAAHEAYGQPLDQIFNIINEHSGKPIDITLNNCIQLGNPIRLASDTLLISRNGEQFAIEDSAAPILNSHEEPLGVVIIFKDVTEQRQKTKELIHHATHDPLTGLVNRREFEHRLERAITASKAHSAQHVLCYIDLDNFKPVNDRAGHAAGDELLQQVVTLLMGKVRFRDTLARLGGDEFALLLDNCPLQKAYEIASELVAEIKNYQFVWQDQPFQIGASIGLVAIDGTADSVSDFLNQADTACYMAKHQGGNQVQIYKEGVEALAQHHGEVIHIATLSNALEQDRLLLYKQPIISLLPDHKTITRHELLVRLVNAQGKIILPGAFIPVAERHGLMAAIDRWVIRTAFQNYNTLFTETSAAGIAINLSGNSLNDDSLPEFIRQQFAESSLPKEQVCFEITEAAVLQNLKQASLFAETMKGEGCRFTLDRFGSGISSFSYLKKLPVDYIKIEGSFVCGMLQNPVDHAMVEAINHIGHSMGIHTIAEWVESDAIIRRLTELGVDYAQGYALSSPRPMLGLHA